MISCDSNEELEDVTCEKQLFYVSSAVCSASSNDAAVRDNNGDLYIARDLFYHIDRANVTVDLEFTADFRIVQAVDTRILCGPLISAPVIDISCFQLAE